MLDVLLVVQRGGICMLLPSRFPWVGHPSPIVVYSTSSDVPYHAGCLSTVALGSASNMRTSIK